MDHVKFGDGLMEEFDSAEELAEAILLTGDVSHLKAAMQVRTEHLAAHIPPSPHLATRDDLGEAEKKLRNHRKQY